MEITSGASSLSRSCGSVFGGERGWSLDVVGSSVDEAGSVDGITFGWMGG